VRSSPLSLSLSVTLSLSLDALDALDAFDALHTLSLFFSVAGVAMNKSCFLFDRYIVNRR